MSGSTERSDSALTLPTRRPLRLRASGLAWTALLLTVLAAAMGYLDLPVAAYFATDPCHHVVRDFLDLSETFGHALGVVVILAAVWCLDRSGRAHIPQIAAGSLGAGLLADVFKLALPRMRPRILEEDFGSVWSTFARPFSEASFQPDMHSFPSAHTSVAVGLAICLAHYYPQGRRLFYFMAFACAGHRLYAQAHYVSDVLVGAGLGFVLSHLCLHVASVSSWLDGVGQSIAGKNAELSAEQVLNWESESRSSQVIGKRRQAG